MPDKTLTAAEFQLAQATMGVIGGLSKTIDWQAYAATVEHAETIGPFVDPTLFMRSPHELRRLLTDMARLLDRYQRFYQQCEAVLSRAVERQGEAHHAG